MATFSRSILCYLIVHFVTECFGDFVLPSRVRRDNNADVTNIGNVPSIYEMDILCNVTNRYATTIVTSKVKNSDSVAREKTFSVILPATAFISGFLMEIGGKTYTAHVMEKKEAQRLYSQAKASGQTAGHIGTSVRDSNSFTVSVSIEPQSSATFRLTYEEMLDRVDGKYEIILNVHPGQIVRDLEIQVHINELSPIKFVTTPELRTGSEISKNEGQTAAEKSMVGDNGAVVKFKPNADQQRLFGVELGAGDKKGIAGQFRVQYDVERTSSGGEVVFDDEHFVQFFAVEDKKTLPSHVVFVLDNSGSMSGRKIRQLREAMGSILYQINYGSLLSVIQFSSCHKVWDIARSSHVNLCAAGDEASGLPEPVLAITSAILNAQKMVNQLEDDELTMMLPALKTALALIKRVKEKEGGRYQQRIIFLTDGQHTDSVTSWKDIVRKITQLNEALGAAIFTLSFGEYANKDFLEELAKKNKGAHKHILETSDAHLQLRNYYKTIANLLLVDINLKCPPGAGECTKNHFDHFFEGDEIVVAGKLLESGKSNFSPQVYYNSSEGKVDASPQKKRSIQPLERAWAYLIIKKALEESKTSTDRDALVKKALDMALKYSFVTDVTSLVVVKPVAASILPPIQQSFDVQGLPGLPGLQPVYIESNAVPEYYRPGSTVNFSLLAPTAGTGMYGGAFPAPEKPGLQSHLDRDDAPKEKVEQIFPWIRSYLTPDRRLLITKGIYGIGKFDLGENLYAKDLETVHCVNAVTGTFGSCTLLNDCPSARTEIYNFDIYLDHYCIIENKYAGVCCSYIEI